MTNEETREIIKQFRDRQGNSSEDVEAFDMAIKALEQQPCEDCISRESVRQLICRNNDKYGYSDRFHEFTEECLKLPSITPQQKVGKWIEKDIDYYKAVNEYGGGVNEDTPYFADDIACPKCLKLFSVIDNETERFNYCPNCGCRMKGEGE